MTQPPSPNPPVLNIQSANFIQLPQLPPKYAGERWNAALALGAQQLGISIIKIPPGKAAFPYHNHHAIEEMFYILEGQGDMIYGQNPVPRAIRQGDVIVCRAGGPETAHQLRNSDPNRTLVYLAVSTKAVVDYVEHPMSQKFCVWVNPSQRVIVNSNNAPGMRYFCGRTNSAVHYFDGEANT
jgi:uncharacterized cupin superfamily protein